MISSSSFKGFLTFALLLGVFAISYVTFNISIDPSYLSFASSDNSKPFNIQVSEITKNSATVSWNTRQLMVGRILYSTDPEECKKGEQAEDCKEATDGGAITSNHKVILLNLNSGTKYYFYIKVHDSLYPITGAINFVTFSD